MGICLFDNSSTLLITVGSDRMYRYAEKLLQSEEDCKRLLVVPGICEFLKCIWDMHFKRESEEIVLHLDCMKEHCKFVNRD